MRLSVMKMLRAPIKIATLPWMYNGRGNDYRHLLFGAIKISKSSKTAGTLPISRRISNSSIISSNSNNSITGEESTFSTNKGMKSAKYNSMNASAKGNSMNASAKGNSMNASAKGNSMNASAKGNSKNASAKGNSMNASAKGNSMNASAKGNNMNASAKRNSVNASSSSNENAGGPEIFNPPRTPAGVAIRRGTVCDYQAVVDLIDEGGVHDYLPALYHNLASDPDNIPFVATWNGKVVGHMLTSVVDGGLTTVLRSGRIHKDYRGLGLYQSLLDHSHRYVSRNVPHHTHEIFSFTDRNDDVCGGFLKIGYRPVYRREGLQMLHRTPKSQVTKTRTDFLNTELNVKELTQLDLQRIFQMPSLCRALFPQRRLYNWFMGYRLLRENIRHLVTPWGGVFASLNLAKPSSSHQLCPEIDRNQPAMTDENSLSSNGFEPFDDRSNFGSLETADIIERDQIQFWKGHSLQKIAMLTFYNCHWTTFGAFYALDIYAKDGLSSDHFRTHLRQNLVNLHCRFPDQNVVLALTFDTTVSRECVTSCLAEQEIVDLMPLQEKWQILYERPA